MCICAAGWLNSASWRSEPPWQLHVLLFYLRTQVDEENWRVQADLEALKEMICTLRPKSLFG
jgi:hypothetical protein